MSKIYTLFPLPLLFLSILLLSSSLSISAQTLPAKVKSCLDKNYSGWKQTSIATDCYSNFSRAVISGDFDGDKKRDYALKFVKVAKAISLLFLSEKQITWRTF